MEDRRETNNAEAIQTLNNQSTTILVMLESHTVSLEYIKNQTSRTNGRVTSLEAQLKTVEPAVKQLEEERANREGALAERKRYISQLATPFIIAIVVAVLQASGVIDINFSI